MMPLRHTLETEMCVHVCVVPHKQSSAGDDVGGKKSKVRPSFIILCHPAACIDTITPLSAALHDTQRSNEGLL